MTRDVKRFLSPYILEMIITCNHWSLCYVLAASGELYCLHSTTVGSYTYLYVYNTDATTDESTTYRFTCYVSTIITIKGTTCRYKYLKKNIHFSYHIVVNYWQSLGLCSGYVWRFPWIRFSFQLLHLSTVDLTYWVNLIVQWILRIDQWLINEILKLHVK